MISTIKKMLTCFLIPAFFSLLPGTNAATLPQGGMMAGMPSLAGIDAKCGRSGMTVHLAFDQPFPGVIYSKGFFSDRNCNYVTEKNVGRMNYTFLIPVDSCGTDGQMEEPTPSRDMYFENTIIIQLDPLITEVWDEAHSLRCLWPHSLMRSVKTAPIKVVDPNFIDVELNERSLNTLMNVQIKPNVRAKRLLKEEITGYIYNGEETSLVFYVNDPTKKMDANVMNCTVTGEGYDNEQLIDRFGCVQRPDLITYFDKSRTTNGIQADLMLYSYLQDLKIDETSKFSIKCQLQICKGECVTPCVNGPIIAGKRRKRRNVHGRRHLDEPLKAGDVDHAVLIVEREQLEGIKETEMCKLSRTVLISGLTLLFIVATLALLSCYLAVRLSKATRK